MKKLLATVAIVGSALGTQAFAQTNYATITSVTPNYQVSTMRQPVQECNLVDVPIYGNAGGGASAGDVLGGMIIGGLIGKGVTNKDNGAAAGAVLGGMIAADKKNNRQAIVGYKQEQRCNTYYNEERVQTIKNYTIVYNWNGVSGRSYTYNQYNVGDKIPVTVSINAN
jgi:uncharacterized protein YcfJ